MNLFNMVDIFIEFYIGYPFIISLEMLTRGISIPKSFFLNMFSLNNFLHYIVSFSKN